MASCLSHCLRQGAGQVVRRPGQPQHKTLDIRLGTGMGHARLGHQTISGKVSIRSSKGNWVRHSHGKDRYGDGNGVGDGTRPVEDISLWMRDTTFVFLGNCLTLHYFVRWDMRSTPAAVSVKQFVPAAVAWQSGPGPGGEAVSQNQFIWLPGREIFINMSHCHQVTLIHFSG